MAAALVVLTGCIYDPPAGQLTVVNKTDVELRIYVGANSRATMRPGDRLETVPLGAEPDSCLSRTLRAVTKDGTRVATFGPPICDGNEWVITEKDLLLAPTPTPGATGP
jgi:hypothetical protein